jgi:hypothetical protein
MVSTSYGDRMQEERALTVGVECYAGQCGEQTPRRARSPVRQLPDRRVLGIARQGFYLNVRYRARSRRPEDDFVVRHTRMTLTGFGRFELAYFRHTGKWFTVFRGLTAAECFREIEENEVFWPTT